MLVAPHIAFASVAVGSALCVRDPARRRRWSEHRRAVCRSRLCDLARCARDRPVQATQLDGTFALHPSLVQTAKMYADHQALFVHAVASPYRDRSHFDGQNVLETGGTSPYQMKDGWLNRLVSMLPAYARPTRSRFAPTVPLALRGRAEVTSYAPSGLPQAPDDLLMRVSQLYDQDAQLRPLWNSAMTRAGLQATPARVRTRRASASSPRVFCHATTARASR